MTKSPTTPVEKKVKKTSTAQAWAEGWNAAVEYMQTQMPRPMKLPPKHY